MGTITFIVTAVPWAGDMKGINPEMNSTSWYVIAAIIAFLILCYLFLTLSKPKNF